MQNKLKAKIVFVMLMHSVLMSFGQTIIPGGIVSGTWPVSGSPYLVQGAISILDNTTLTIDPGVIVEFQGHFKLQVEGSLLAVGTISDSIIFTAVNPVSRWHGIRIASTPASNDTSRFVYCRIQWGLATGSGEDEFGGAFLIKDFSKVLIDHCAINSNAAYSGGGIYCLNSSPVISYNTIAFNSGYYNGGIYCYNSSPVIYSNVISNNSSNISGGALLCAANSNPEITHNTISNNAAIGGGGGAFYGTQSSPVIAYNAISGNTSFLNAGGIYADVGCNSEIHDNIISYNSCTYGTGGGITCNFDNPVIYNNLISNNSAAGGGGIGTNVNNSPEISNNLIVNNTATDVSAGGGGIAFGSSNAILTNNTIVNNSAAGMGGAVIVSTASNPVFRNCILFGNTASISGPQVFLGDEPSDPAFYFCDVEGDSAAFGETGTNYSGIYLNNINVNPSLMAPSAGTGTGFDGVTSDCSLQTGSPCIDSGDPGGNYPATDIAGDPRIFGGFIDMGAYEYQGGVGITEHIISGKMVVAPNPFSTAAIILLPANENSSTLDIYNICGQMVLTIKGISGDSIKIERGNLNAGIYFYQWSGNNDNRITGKFVIVD